ncbi:MAG: hypothetical protein KBB29_09120 [Bacteroidales bacterium]|jgi:acyl-ACP thioesterase|nr:hypothetical protein [Bacteroidales bacterium]HOG71336.1 thioesterase [Tenuifilaceae bacterium]MBP8642926.1 hypothetical protein [Bacteroidales bacterium]HPA66713.1 thioesterase [Tenuifilaceae bacterium]HPS05740.1 thioesterase [Tenuifilaceae bacterium]
MDLNSYSLPQYLTRSMVVQSYEVDFNQRFSITSIFNHLQEIAWEHADKLSYGYNHLREKGWFWALSRVEVEFYRFPVWQEAVTLVTWPRGADGIFALRDFEFYDSNGNKLIAATSSWLVVGVENRRPVRIAEWYLESDFASRSALNRNAAKIPESIVQPAFTEQFEVRAGDIDMNLHVNNVRYIDWAYNTFTISSLRKYFPKKISVNYNSEAKEGDSILINRKNIPGNSTLININSRLEGEKNYCRIQFDWRNLE